MDTRRVREDIQATIAELISSGREIGLQVVVLHHGDVVADVAAGVADASSGRPVSADTLFWAGSAAKGVASSVAHVLVEQGVLDYDVRVASVWPEFGAYGKDAITLRHILNHTAGIPGLPPDLTVADLEDWDRMCDILAAAEPWWQPGSAFGYHAHTFGFLLGETLRRVTGLPIAALLRERVAGPLGIADDVFFGVPARDLPRVAPQVPSGRPQPAPDADSPQGRASPPGIHHDAAYANRPDILAAAIPSEGTMSAHALARIYAGLLGHLDGVRLVAPERLVAMASVTYTGPDLVMGMPTSSAFGYSPYRPTGSRPGSTFGMVGMTGSGGFADIESGVVVAVMRNRFVPGDFSALTRIDEIIAANLAW